MRGVLISPLPPFSSHPFDRWIDSFFFAHVCTTPTPNPQSPAKKVKKVKDPNAPKRPQSAYFLFMADFRPTFKKANPDSKGVKEVAVAAGAAWAKMSDKDKEKYNTAAAKAKAAYDAKK